MAPLLLLAQLPSPQLEDSLQGVLSSLWAWLVLSLAALAGILGIVKGLWDVRFHLSWWSKHAQFLRSFDTTITDFQPRVPSKFLVQEAGRLLGKEMATVMHERTHPSSSNRIHPSNATGFKKSADLFKNFPSPHQNAKEICIGGSWMELVPKEINCRLAPMMLPESDLVSDDVFKPRASGVSMLGASKSVRLGAVGEGVVSSCKLASSISEEIELCGLGFSIPQWARSLLQPLPVPLPKGAVTDDHNSQSYESGWDTILNLRLKTLVDRSFLNFRHIHSEGLPLIVVGGPTHSVMAKGQMVKLWDCMRGLSVRTDGLENQFVTTVDANWLTAIVSIARSDCGVLIWDFNRPHCITTVPAHEGAIQALTMGADLITFTRKSSPEKREVSVSFWDSRTWRRPAGMTSALKGILHGIQLKGYELYGCDGESSISFHDLRMTRASPVYTKGLADLRVERSGSEDQSNASIHAEPDKSLVNDMLENRKKETEQQQQQDTWWDVDAVLLGKDDEDVSDDYCEGWLEVEASHSFLSVRVQ